MVSIFWFIWLVLIIFSLFLAVFSMIQDVRYWIKYVKIEKSVNWLVYIEDDRAEDYIDVYLKYRLKSYRYSLLSMCSLLFYDVSALIVQPSISYVLLTLFVLFVSVSSFNNVRNIEGVINERNSKRNTK